MGGVDDARSGSLAGITTDEGVLERCTAWVNNVVAAGRTVAQLRTTAPRQTKLPVDHRLIPALLGIAVPTFAS